MSMYEIDSAYVRRCQKRLQEWGAPLSGWYCEYIYDVADEEEDPDHIDLFTCELCDCSQVRFVHVMRHDEYFEVGQGLINGSGSNLVPKAQATRAQVAAIIHRYLER